MRTTVDIEEGLLDEVVKITGEKSKSKALNKALEDYIRRKRIQELRAALGTIDLVDNWYELRHMEPRLLMIIIDTSVWVQGFRLRAAPERLEVDRLLARDEAAVVGVVLAEVLQGARNPREFEELRGWLTALPYLEETRDTWARVGGLSYQMHRNGTPVSLLDLVIAALALEDNCAVYTLDEHFQRIPGLQLHQVGKTN